MSEVDLLEFPLDIKRRANWWELIGANGDMVAEIYDKELAEYFMRIGNAHEGLVEALAKALYQLTMWNDGSDIEWENVDDEIKIEYRAQAIDLAGETKTTQEE